MKQLESGFKRTINWNKYQSKITGQTQNRYSDFLIDPSFQIVNMLFVLSFENKDVRESYKRYFLPNGEINDYNVLIDGRNFYDQQVKCNLRTYHNIRKIATGQVWWLTDCLQNYSYFKEHYKLIETDLSKKQKLHADAKAIK